MVTFTEELARGVLWEIRDGKTLRSACEKLGRGIDKTDVYDWLRDPKAKVDGESFADAFEKADEDRRMTWREMAMKMIADLPGDTSAAELSVVKAKAQMLLTAAKENAIEVFSRSVTSRTDAEGNKQTIVVIRKFAPEPLDEDLE